jgi:tetratricopeptide (TPR) repeat protein
MHQQVARSLETLYAKSLEGHAAELAEHFSHSTEPADLKKAVKYGEMAAKRATDVYAYGEAVRLLEQAFKVQEVLDPEDKTKRCDLLLALGDALLLAGETQRVIGTEAAQAFSLAEAMADNKRASRACLLVMKGLGTYGATMMTSPVATQWAARADRYSQPDTVERAWTDSLLSFAEWSAASSSPEGIALITRALDSARRLGDPDTYWWVSSMWLSTAKAPQHDEEQLRLAEELAAHSRQGVSFMTLYWTLWMMAHTFLEFGMRSRAEDIMDEMRTLAERSGQPHVHILSMVYDALRAIWDGRLEEAVAIRHRVLALGEELGMGQFAGIYASWILPASVYIGNAGQALESRLQVAIGHSQNTVSSQSILFYLTHLGRHAEVAEMLERLVVARPGIGSGEDETMVCLNITSLEAAVLAGHRQAAELLLHRLAGCSKLTSGLWITTCAGRHMGAAAAFLGRHEEACKYYQKAIKDCTEMKFRPELALTHLQLAELLLEHYPKKRAKALEHLDFAIKEFQDMKMQPSLERALRHKEILKA